MHTVKPLQDLVFKGDLVSSCRGIHETQRGALWRAPECFAYPAWQIFNSKAFKSMQLINNLIKLLQKWPKTER